MRKRSIVIVLISFVSACSVLKNSGSENVKAEADAKQTDKAHTVEMQERAVGDDALAGWESNSRTLGKIEGRLFQRAEKSPAAIPNPHHHRRGEDVLSDVALEIKFVEAAVTSDTRKENLIVNKAKTFRAFTTATTDGFEQIFFEDMRTNKTYEIQGVDWAGRPLNDPVCLGNYFIFDRSSNPHAAIHYVFDMNKRALVAARAFSE